MSKTTINPLFAMFSIFIMLGILSHGIHVESIVSFNRSIYKQESLCINRFAHVDISAGAVIYSSNLKWQTSESRQRNEEYFIQGLEST